MFSVPEHAGQKLAFLPCLNIVEYFENGPKYVEILTDDECMAQVAGSFMCWFYGRVDMILAPSEWYRQHLQENGLTHKRIEAMACGVSGVAFWPRKRDTNHPVRYGCSGHFKFLYVERIPWEKNVTHQQQRSHRLRERGQEAVLALVGDGPLSGEIRESCGKRPDVFFAGLLSGDELAKTYAAARLGTATDTRDSLRERASWNADEKTWGCVFERFWHNHPQLLVKG